MSRCYPFPPPGYVKKDCLIESIKGAKEEVKKDRKHKKKEKKRKESDNEAGRSKRHRHKRQRKDDEVANVSNKVDDHCKLINSEVELLEKSCITVELELQTSSQTSCDSTLHSNERPKQSQSQPLDGRHNDSGEFVCVLLVLGLFVSTSSMVTFFLQICCYGFEETGVGKRLSGTGQKDFEAEVMITNKDQKRHERLDFGRAHSTSANEASRDALRVCQGKRKDPIFDSRDVERKHSKEKKPIPQKDNRKNSKEKMQSSLSSSSSSSHQETSGPSNPSCRKCPPSMAVQFFNLIENWTPDRFEGNLTNSEDQEWWLFMNFGTKRHQVCNQNTEHRSSSSTLWPTARFLPEAEVHALPFTVPYWLYNKVGRESG